LRADRPAPVPRDPARRDLAALVEDGRGRALGRERGRDAVAAGPRQAGPARRSGEVSSIEERRELFAKYKEDVKTRGKSFFPGAMFHDTVMSLVVVSIIIGLAIIWKETATGDPPTGMLGKVYDQPADPGTFSFVPRPDWYFYFLFYLLRIFKWPDSVILGT